MTPLGRHYHIPSTVTDPVQERVPRAGIPVVKRTNEERKITMKEEDSTLALVPTVCVKGG